MIAATCNHTDMIVDLVEVAGANIDLQDVHGETVWTKFNWTKMMVDPTRVPALSDS